MERNTIRGALWAWVAAAGMLAGCVATPGGTGTTPKANRNPRTTTGPLKLPGLLAEGGTGNLVGGAGGGILASGGGNALPVGGGAGVLASGGGNVLASGGGNVLASGGGNALAENADRAPTIQGNGILASGGGNLIAAPAGLTANATASGLIANDGSSMVGGRAFGMVPNSSAYRLAATAAWRVPLASARAHVELADGSLWGEAVEVNADGYFAFPKQPPEGAVVVATGQVGGQAYTVRGPVTRGTGLWVLCPGSTVALEILKAQGSTAAQSLDASSFRAWADAICVAARNELKAEDMVAPTTLTTWYQSKVKEADSSLADLGEVALATRKAVVEGSSVDTVATTTVELASPVQVGTTTSKPMPSGGVATQPAEERSATLE